MNQKVSFQQMIPLLFVLLIVGTVALLIVNLNSAPAIQVAPVISDNQAELFDYEQAANVSAQRWLAMAKFYEEEGLLTRSTFDYQQAADVKAFRWQAMAKEYERLGLLNFSNNPDDAMAYRWQAMAEAYERMGLLNEQ